MGFTTYAGTLPASVQHNGLVGYVNGSPISASDAFADDQDLQAPVASAALAGVLTGGVCTAAALNVTIPAGTSYFAKAIWVTSGAVVVAVGDNSTTYLWGCSDGVIRPTATNVLPTSFDARSACLLVKAVAVAGAVTLDNSVRQTARSADPVLRKVQDGPLSLDYANNVIDVSGAALKIPAFTADPTVPAVGVFLWYRTDLHELCVSESGTVKRTGALT